MVLLHCSTTNSAPLFRRMFHRFPHCKTGSPCVYQTIHQSRFSVACIGETRFTGELQWEKVKKMRHRTTGIHRSRGELLLRFTEWFTAACFTGESTVKKKKNFTSFGQPNKADHLCQLWQSSSNLFVDHVCVWMCQCQKGPQYPLTKSSCQPTVCAYEWRCPIVKWHLIVYCR